MSSGPPIKRIRQIAGQSRLSFAPPKIGAGPSCVTTGNVFHGYEVKDVPPDNNCLFSAIGHQLQLDNAQGVAPTCGEVRAQLVDYLKQNRQLFSEFFCADSVFRQTRARDSDSEQESFEEYVERMEIDGTWGDGTMLGIASMAYNRPVIVIYVMNSKEQQKIVIDKTASSVDEQKTNPICLGLLSSHNEANNHYVSLLPNPRSQEAALTTDSTTSSSPENEAKAEIPEAEQLRFEPNQPSGPDCFPSRFYEKENRYRSFSAKYYESYKWLHWDDNTRRIFCFACKMSTMKNLLTFTKSPELTFSINGFDNWKDCKRVFKGHEESSMHKEAIMKWNAYCSQPSVIGQLSSEALKQQQKAATYLLTSISSLKYLARQGMPIRGHEENEGNYRQLLQLRSADVEGLSGWLSRRGNWLSHDMQDEMLQIMALDVLRKIVDRIKSNRFFSLIVDETTDESTKEQLSICIRHVDIGSTAEVFEDFIGLYESSKTDAGTITTVIKDVLLRCNLRTEDCRGQCYDGASNMSGRLNGVAARIVSENPKAAYVHCSAHSFNLAVQDSVRSVPCMRDMLDYVHEIAVTVRASAKRLAAFKAIQSEHSTCDVSLKPLCPTRWTVRVAAIEAVLCNYAALQLVLADIVDENCGRDVSRKARGIQLMMEKFDFLFALHVGLELLRGLEVLSKMLQGSSLSAAEAKAAADVEVARLRRIRGDDNAFETLWAKVEDSASDLGVQEAQLPRKRRPPQRLDDGSEAHHFTTAKDLYRSIFFQCIDNSSQQICRRFEQASFVKYLELERLLLRASSGEEYSEEYQSVCECFSGDIDPRRLANQLSMMQDVCKRNESKVSSIVGALDALGKGRELFSEILTLLQLYYVLPASSATAERSFSSLRRLKNYLRTTMTQTRLNNLMVLHVHKDMSDALDVRKIAREFVLRQPGRCQVFGTDF